MASPSSARVSVGSSTKQIHGSKRDATARSRIIGASTVSNSSRRVNGSVANVNGGAGHSSGHSTRVYLDGQDVTPQSLLAEAKEVEALAPKLTLSALLLPGLHGRASFLFSTASTSSADNDSDNESSSSIVGTAVKAPRKEPKPNVGDHPTANSVAPSSNQEEDENTRLAATAGPTDTEDHEEGKDEAGDPLTGLGPDQDTPLLVGRKSMTKKGSDKYVQGRTQTLQLAQKAKEVMTAPPATRDAACLEEETNAEDEVGGAIPNGATQAQTTSSEGSSKVAEGTPASTGQNRLVRVLMETLSKIYVPDSTMLPDQVARRETDTRQHTCQGIPTRPLSPATKVAAIFQLELKVQVRVVQDQFSSWNSVANASRGVLSGAAVGSGDQRANNVYARANTNVDLGEIIARQRTSHHVERAVQQNVYHEQHVRYRDYPMLETAETVTEPPNVIVPALDMGFPGSVGSGRSNSFSIGLKCIEELEKLWTFSCELTKNRTVSCLAWNTATKIYWQSLTPATSNRPKPNCLQLHVLLQRMAVSTRPVILYLDLGNMLNLLLQRPQQLELRGQKKMLPVGVTSIDFSTAHPYLLAVGFADGVVSIYDTRKDDSISSGSSSSASTSLGVTATPTARHVPVPIATSSGLSGKHLDAVWQVKWVAHGGSESVVSVSADGRVVEWSLKKGLSYSDLMTLKRAPNPLLGGPVLLQLEQTESGEAQMDQGDPSVYYVGTEDGLVHKCSVSYNEQYLQTYIGTLVLDLFLSCSGDWSLKLWHQADPHGEATLTFHSVDLAKAVLGASWSPSDAGVFAAVAEDGRIELWDLIQSTLDPIGDNDETYRDPNAVEIPATTMVEVPLECTTVAFAPKAPVLIVGDSTGDVTVYRVPRKSPKVQPAMVKLPTRRHISRIRLLIAAHYSLK
ncbi:WD40-repeat-containing domain [Phytophthora cactorum]|nr:WD40-repeat-containing domain [Phytophthora cactorum]